MWAVHWYCKCGIGADELQEDAGEREGVVSISVTAGFQRYAPEAENGCAGHWRTSDLLPVAHSDEPT